MKTYILYRNKLKEYWSVVISCLLDSNKYFVFFPSFVNLANFFTFFKNLAIKFDKKRRFLRWTWRSTKNLTISRPLPDFAKNLQKSANFEILAKIARWISAHFSSTSSVSWTSMRNRASLYWAKIRDFVQNECRFSVIHCFSLILSIGPLSWTKRPFGVSAYRVRWELDRKKFTKNFCLIFEVISNPGMIPHRTLIASTWPKSGSERYLLR